MPSHTFIATWLAVTHTGARPVPVEPDPCTYNIDPDRIAAAVTSKTRAIIPVHLYGQPADMDPIIALAARHGFVVVEDAAQAHGARYKGRRTGGLGHLAAFSFYPGKNLGALGDAGVVTTDDDKLADRLRRLRNYGSEQKYKSDEIGFNARLDEIQAAFLSIKLGYLEADNLIRKKQAAIYCAALTGFGLGLPTVPSWAEPTWHLFVVRSKIRDKLQQCLTKAGIGTLIHYPFPPHLQGAYQNQNIANAGDLPLAESLADEVLSLPIGPLLSLQNQELVITACQEACRDMSLAEPS